MTIFLRFQVGSYPFVFPAARLIAIEAAASESASCRSWRGRALPLLDLTRYVGSVEGQVRHDLVLEDEVPGVAACIVRVDQVDGLIELEGSREEPLLTAIDNVQALIESICINGKGARSTMLYKLRVPREAFATEAHQNE